MRPFFNDRNLSPKRRHQLIPLWAGFVLLAAVLHLAIDALLDEARENRATAHRDGFRRSLEVTISIYGRFSDFVFREAVDRPEHTGLIAAAWRSGPGARRDALRRELFRRMEPLYARVQRDFFRQLHFHFPDTTSFLRMHSPEHYGDRLHDFRESVRLANLNQVPVRGFEEGRVINGYRFVHPLFDRAAGEPLHVGSVEVSISMGSLIGTLAGYSPGRFRFAIARAQIEKKLFADARRHYLEWEGLPGFLIDRALYDGPLLPDADCEKTHLPQLLAPLLAEGRDFAVRHHCNGKAYLVSALALTNFHREVAAYLVGVEEDRADPAERGRYRIFQGGFTLLLLLLAGFLTRIINDRHRIRRLALHDHLTGAWNRLVFEGLFRREVEKARRYKRPLSLVLFDIDHFKRVNDTHGHAAGDRVLKRLVRVTESRIRTADYLVRWGGEEFLLLLPETGAAGAMVTAEKLRLALAAADMGIPAPVTASFGVSCFHGEGETLEALVHEADQRLYQAKQAGRNRVCGPESC